MKLQKTVGTWSVTATVVVMYLAVVFLLPLIDGYPAFKFVGAVLVSISVYRLFAAGMYLILEKSQWIRQKALGEEFLEGTWVGRIRREPVEYTVEEYRYRNGIVEIEGRSYLEDKTERSHWFSTALSLDVAHRRLFYAYECRTEGVDKPPEGIGAFRLHWSNSDLSACDRLEGFATDVSDGKRDSNTEHKVSEKWIGFDEGFKKAIETFKNK